ncbi:MAG TPA: right-handed parallel beta-helix repeat-containing protein [Actinomycetota bacterium]|nr:right-handed parallel beta-helix repeat-containing protein [Actinomycetota bacterium]
MLVLLCAAVAFSGFAPARADVHAVQVRNNVYSPQELRVARGDTVVWTAFDDGHTVTAEDLSFDYYATRTMRKGESVQHTFTEDATVYYSCRVHRPAMFGVVVVGTGGSGGGGGGEPPEVRNVPTAEFPTIGSAVKDASPGSIVEIAPGRYVEDVLVRAPGLTIRGSGTSPSHVILEGASQRATAFRVTANLTRIENLTVQGFSSNGIIFEEVEGFAVTSVRALDNGAYGVRAVGSRFGVLRNVRALRSAVAGISIASCKTCDVIIENSYASENYIGVQGVDAGSLVIRDSQFVNNLSGVVLRSGATGRGPQSGSHVYGNEVHDNATRTVPGSRSRAPDDIAAGIGIWLAGGMHGVIEDNVVSGNEYGIAVTWFAFPSMQVRVVGNDVDRSRHADLAWDGIGANVCFAGNAAASGGSVSSDPPAIESVYACDAPATVGIPNPRIVANILLYTQRV